MADASVKTMIRIRKRRIGVTQPRPFRLFLLSIVSIFFSLICCSLFAQVPAGLDVNTSKKAGPDSECAIAKNPADSSQLFAVCNTTIPGLFATRSDDGGKTWSYPDSTDKTIADGDKGQGAPACCDPTVAWDSFGNLYVGYLDNYWANFIVLLSTDAGMSFKTLHTFAGSADQPTIVAEDTPAAGAPVAVWVVWNLAGTMHASG
ncbi:MAG: glycoside hydrolase, partial [Gammaproteobacteria bacterium]|nr:glycoside hydrolase [Gammaproteobacteria bacterium]